jgi:AraC-like DNA-binding protein
MPTLTRIGEVTSPSLTVRLVHCDGEDSGSSDEQADANGIWFVLKGRFSIRRSSGRLIADPSVAVSLREGDHFRISHPEGCGDLCLVAWGALADEVASQRRARRSTTSPGYHRLRSLARSIALAHNPELSTIEEALLEAIDSRDPCEQSASRRDRAIAEAAAHEIGMRFDEQISLSDLAAPLGVSIFALSRAFRRVHGVPVHRWRQRLRVRHALAAILDSRRSLAAVAADCGFSSHAHLTALFRREIGLTPSEVRAAGWRFPRGR